MSNGPVAGLQQRQTTQAEPIAGATRVWLAMLVIALITRWAMLNATALTPVEAIRALAALEAVAGRGWQAAPESPLLLVGQALLFTLFGPANGLARALPALAGVGIAAVPLLWRKQLGDLGALSAAGLLVISPLTLFAARRVDSTALGALGGALLVTLLICPTINGGTDIRRRRWWLAAGTTLGLIGGPAFYDLVIPGVLAWFAVRRRRRLTERSWRAIAVGAGLALLISLAFGLRWSGWSGLTEGFVAWLTSRRERPIGGISPLGLLALYEPLLLTTGVAGAILLLSASARRGLKTQESERAAGSTDVQLRSLAVWGLLALVLQILRPGSSAGALSSALIPVGLLGGYGVQQILNAARSDSRRWMGLHALASFLLWLPGLLTLAQHARGFAVTDQVLLVIIGAAVLIGLQIMLVLLFALLMPANDLWRSTFLGAAAVLLLVQASFAFGLAYVRPDSPVEPALTTTTSRDVEYLRQALHSIANTRGERADALPVVIIDNDADVTAVLRWHLREFRALEVTRHWPQNPRALVLTTGEGNLPMPEAPELWRGMSFVTLTRYDAPAPRCSRLLPPQCSAALAWYLYRESPYETRATNTLLWQSEASAVR